MTRVPIAFLPRHDRLDPLAVVGVGPVARALGERLLCKTDDQLHGLRGVAGDQVLLVLGANESLPWVDGVAYLGRDPEAPRLLLPTMLRPPVAMDVFERAIVRHASALSCPLAVLSSASRIISAADALPIERAHLRTWLATQPGATP